MKILLQDVGTINQANIEINPLTIIAGENNTGKSTVGKMIFSIIKSTSKYRQELGEDREEEIKSLVQSIYFSFLALLNLEKIKIKDIKNFQSTFDIKNFIDDINKNGIEALKIKKDNLFQYKLSKNTTDLLTGLFDKLEKYITQDYTDIEAKKRALKKMLYSEFYGDINNRLNPNSEAKIDINDNDISMNISIKDFDNINISQNGKLKYNDSTFIETPLILNFSDAIDKSITEFEINNKENKLDFISFANISFHIKDLNNKLKAKYAEKCNVDLIDKISNIINGEITYNTDKKEFIYTKNGIDYKGINTASGIKAFGIINILLKNGFLDEKSILIIDEPEVHLHPKWQLKYVELILELAKNNIKILITTHSPYMIEAFEEFSKKYKILTKFYCTKESERGEIIEDVTDDLNIIYKALSDPLDDLEKAGLDNFQW